QELRNHCENKSQPAINNNNKELPAISPANSNNQAAACGAGAKAIIKNISNFAAPEEKKVDLNKFCDKVRNYYSNQGIFSLPGKDKTLLYDNAFAEVTIIEQKLLQEITKKHASASQPVAKIVSRRRGANKKVVPVIVDAKTEQLLNEFTQQLFTTHKESFPLADLINNKDVHRILIEGAPGVGKSTLGKAISYFHARKHEKHLAGCHDHYDIIFWLPLEKLLELSPGKVSLAQFIRKLCVILDKDFSDKQITSAIKKLVEADKVLFLLDNYHSVANFSELSDIGSVVQQLLNMPRYIITSRHGFLESCRLTKKPSLAKFINIELVIRRMELLGLSEKGIQQYITTFYNIAEFDYEEYKQRCLDTLPALISNNKEFIGIVNIPLFLEQLCSMWQEYPDDEKIENDFLTRTMLCKKMISSLKKDYIKHQLLKPAGSENNKTLSENEKERHKAEHELKKKVIAPSVKIIGKLAWETIQQSAFIVQANKAHISHLSQAKETGELELIKKCAFKELGLLKSHGISTELLPGKYYFPHASLQEYEAAMFIAKCLLFPLEYPADETRKFF
ncbi:MAG: NACHT domain-containing protein, partial [Gammaproteobacteria bacterium]